MQINSNELSKLASNLDFLIKNLSMNKLYGNTAANFLLYIRMITPIDEIEIKQ